MPPRPNTITRKGKLLTLVTSKKDTNKASAVKKRLMNQGYEVVEIVKTKGRTHPGSEYNIYGRIKK